MVILYPGSFDPVTYGHVDIALRGLKLASRLVIGILNNPVKKSLFSAEERLVFLQEVFCDYENVEVNCFSGMLVEYAQTLGAAAILRGVRNFADFETENIYAANNLAIGNIETIFMPSKPELSHVSSSVVREAASYIYGGSALEQGDSALQQMVPPGVCTALKRKFR